MTTCVVASSAYTANRHLNMCCCLESSGCSMLSWSMQKLILRPSVAGTLTLKQCSRVHQNTPFSFSAPNLSAPTASRPSLKPWPPFQNPAYTTGSYETVLSSLRLKTFELMIKLRRGKFGIQIRHRDSTSTFNKDTDRQKSRSTPRAQQAMVITSVSMFLPRW